MELKINFTVPTYECSCCHKNKAANEFYTEAYTGHRTSQCKECINIKRKVVRGKARHSKFVSKEKVRGIEEVDYTLDDWRDVMLHFHGQCAFCGKTEGRAKKERFDRDHLIPLSKGGKTERKNIIPACSKCNRGRGNKDWLEWFKEQPFYSEERARQIVAWLNQ